MCRPSDEKIVTPHNEKAACQAAFIVALKVQRHSVGSAVFIHRLKLLEVTCFSMPGLQQRLYFIRSDSLQRHQHQHVIGKIADFADGLFIFSIFSSDQNFSAFLSHLFEVLSIP